LILTIIAMNSRTTNPEDARGKAKIGLILGIVSIVIGLIVSGCYMILVIAADA
jgi:hypothetical protein